MKYRHPPSSQELEIEERVEDSWRSKTALFTTALETEQTPVKVSRSRKMLDEARGGRTFRHLHFVYLSAAFENIFAWLPDSFWVYVDNAAAGCNLMNAWGVILTLVAAIGVGHACLFESCMPKGTKALSEGNENIDFRCNTDQTQTTNSISGAQYSPFRF